jgi:Uma2 family endonuclease
MSSLPQPRLTPEQYLVIERDAPCKSEYFDGAMFAMAGATREHNLICTNVTRELSQQLRGQPCETYAGDMRVKVAATGLYTYPDVVVVCGERQFEDGRRDTLLNPTMIVEVLSPSTAAYDRGDKFTHYQHLDSLREYLLIAQDQPRIEHYLRNDRQEWLRSDALGPESTLRLTSTGCALKLSDVYERIEFPPRSASHPSAPSSADAE